MKSENFNFSVDAGMGIPEAEEPTPQPAPPEAKPESKPGILSREESVREFLGGFKKIHTEDAKEALAPLIDKGKRNIEPAIQFAGDIVKERRDGGLKEKTWGYADIDDRILTYIEKTLQRSKEAADSNVRLMEDDEIGLFASYLRAVKGKPIKAKDKFKHTKENIEELEEQLKALKKRIAGLKTTKTPPTEKPEEEKPKPPAGEKGIAEHGSVKKEALPVEKEIFNKGDRVVYTMKSGEVFGVIQGFENKKDGNIKAIIFLKDGETAPITIRTADFIKRNPKKAGTAETPTVEMAKSESGDTIVETKPEETAPAEQPPEVNLNNFVSETTLELLGFAGKKIGAAEAPGILRSLDEKRQEVETSLLKETDEEIKKELLEQKRNICLGIIEIESEIQEKDLKEELKNEEQRQYKINLHGKTEEEHKAALREKYYNDVIENSKLPEAQRNDIAKHFQLSTQWTHGFLTRPFYKINLNKQETIALIDAGINIEEIGWVNGDKFPWLLTKIQVEGKKMSKEEFESFVLEKYNLLENKIKESIQQRKEEIIDKGGIRDYALAEKANEIIGKLPDDTPDVAPEFSEKFEEENNLNPQTPEEQLQELNELIVSRGRANKLNRDIKKYQERWTAEGQDWLKEEMARVGVKTAQEYFDKLENGPTDTILEEDKNNPEKMEELERFVKDKIEEEKNKEELKLASNKIIEIANRISGRSLRREFWAKKFEEGKITSKKPTSAERDIFRNEFRNWVTDEVQKICKNSFELLQGVAKAAGKNLARKGAKTLNDIFPYSENWPKE